MYITFPTARPPTTERMTPQTLITRVCKTETMGTAHHKGDTRDTTTAATGDTDPASRRGRSQQPKGTCDSQPITPTLWKWG